MADLLGIFGGTFDPPHLGHLILAAEALQQLNLSRVIWVPTPIPPHKPNISITPFHHRLEMVKRTVHGIPNFEMSSIENERPGPHYMLDTIDILQDRNPSSRLVLLIGGDSLRDLHSWNRPKEIVTALFAFGVMRRPGDKINLSEVENALPGIKSKLRFFETPQIEISASDIRTRIALHKQYRFFVHANVYEYIEQNQLYQVLR